MARRRRTTAVGGDGGSAGSTACDTRSGAELGAERGAELGAALGAVEILADADRPGGHLLLIDRIRQSYVDLEDPTYLDFEYMQAFADVLDAMPPGPLAITHVGGGAYTAARYVAATRPGSSQIVLEPDTGMTDVVRARLPLPKRSGIRVRGVDGRTGVGALKDDSADVIVLDAFHGGRVPAELSTVEFVVAAARVLRPGGVLLANVADGHDLLFTRRFVATLQTALPQVLVIADPGVLKGRRFGNLVLAASLGSLPVDVIVRAGARAAFPRSVQDAGRVLRGQPAPLTDAAPMRSPSPPDETWRVGGTDQV